jgi:hypothetical protein
MGQHLASFDKPIIQLLLVSINHIPPVLVVRFPTQDPGQGG